MQTLNLTNWSQKWTKNHTYLAVTYRKRSKKL